MENKNSRNKYKKIVIFVSIVLALIGGIAGYFMLFHKGEVIINDYTEEVKTENINGDGTDNEPEVVISSNVNMYTSTDAEKINESIQSIRFMNTGLHINIAKGSALDDIGIGEIFYLEGSTNTPLGETYIGKIISKSESEGEISYIVETPMVDEVFDVLKFEYSQIMTTDNITDIKTVDGVSVVTTDNLISDFAMETNHRQDINLIYQGEKKQAFGVNDSKNTEGLLFEFNIDLLKTFGLNEKNTGEFQEKYDVTEGGRITVYRTATGICYHRENCACVGRSKANLTLTEAVLEGFEPCYLCNPPLLEQEGNSNFDASLTLEGKVGLESIDFNINYDWDILSGSGLEELELTANGNFLAQAEVKSNLQYEFGGRATTISVPVADAKFEGLKEKLFPLAFVGYNGTFTPAVTGNESIRALTGAVPITVGAMVYVDISGNVSVSAKAYIDYSQSFQYKNTVVKNGEWIVKSDIKSEPVFNAGIETEVQGDIDAHLGCSIDLYVFNLNVVDLAIAKVGAEAEGTLKIDYSNESQMDSDSAISSSYYMRIYYKLLELNIKLKTKIEMWDLANVSDEQKYTFLYMDKTLAEWGSKSPVYYNYEKMSHTSVTAQDGDAFYYKDTNGQLIKEVEGYKTILYSNEFFSICGIDDSYIYILKTNDKKTYDIYRVSKEGNANRRIAEDVVRCFTMDEKNLYFITDFDKTSIRKLNRENLEEEMFSDFQDDVTFMEVQDNAFYVVTEEYNPLSWFTGAELNYYLVDTSGNVVKNYGAKPDISQYFYSDFGTYYKVAKMTSSGYLRSTAQEVHWMSKDKQKSILTECVSGWNYNEEGIVTAIESMDTGKKTYTIVLYGAEDGKRIEMTDVYNEHAIFTLRKGNNGNWYFFDQTEKQLILYELKSDFSSKTSIKVFPLSEIPYNISECGMTIMDNRLYFYTMPDEHTSHVLYRYNIF